MSNQSQPALEISPLETAARAAVTTFEQLMPEGCRYILVFADGGADEAGILANVAHEEITEVVGALGDIYDLEIEQ